MENEMVRRLMFSGLLAGIGALGAILSRKLAEQIWRAVFNEEPPLD